MPEISGSTETGTATEAWRPNARAARLHRASLYRCIREFFAERNVLEVTTPVLVAGAPADPGVESWAAQSGSGATAYLQTSPEYAMKRLLAAGSGDIFQICQVFRGDEHGSRHNPEFTLLEWYCLGFDQQQLMTELVALIHAALAAVPIGTGLAAPARPVRYAEIFDAELRLDPLSCSPAACADRARNLGLTVVGELDRDAWLELLMAMVLAPRFPADRLTLVYDYPLSQAILARASPDNPGYAARFELYWGDLELANGFHELTDAGDYQRRVTENHAIRRARGQTIPREDHRFAAAMAAGLPDCAGVAVGVDRLLMRLIGADHLGAVLDFPWGQN